MNLSSDDKQESELAGNNSCTMNKACSAKYNSLQHLCTDLEARKRVGANTRARLRASILLWELQIICENKSNRCCRTIRWVGGSSSIRS